RNTASPGRCRAFEVVGVVVQVSRPRGCGREARTTSRPQPSAPDLDTRRCTMTRFRTILATWSVVAFAAGTIRADEPKWKQHTINGRSEFEAAGVFDVDNDGQLDIVSGDTWYQGPGWKPSHVRDVERV